MLVAVDRASMSALARLHRKPCRPIQDLQMLIHEADQRSSRIDIHLAATLAGVAGALNAAGFQAAGFFSANMTGNLSALSDHVGLGRFAAAAPFAVLLFAFMAGAFTSGLLIEAGRRRAIRAIYAYSIALEASLLMLLGGADVMLPAISPTLVVLALSFVMGLQNAATTRISNARVRTTHVSGMATDIGLGLAALSGTGADRRNALDRLHLYAYTIIAFMAGGIVGVVLYVAIGGFLWMVAASILFIIVLPQIRQAWASGQAAP